MDQLGILLHLKDLLKDTCGKQAISSLMQFPLICNYLNDEVNLQKVINRSGNDCTLWTPLNICKVAAGIDFNLTPANNPDNLEKTKIEEQTTSSNLLSIDKINALYEVFPIAQLIAAIGDKNSWQEIFEQVRLGSYSYCDSKKILETVFTVVYELIENKDKFICGLLDYSVQEPGPKLLARLLMLNTSSNELLMDSFETIFPYKSLDKFMSLIREMQFLGDQKISMDLARKFTKIHPYDGVTIQDQAFQALPDDLTKIRYLKNYAALFQLIDNEEKVGKISLEAKVILSSVGQKLGLKSYFENLNIKNDEEIIIESDPVAKELIQEISRIRNVTKTDIESAILMAQELSRKILIHSDLGNIIFDRDFGFLIKPEDLAQVFIDLELIVQAHAILKKLLEWWPYNIQLLRTAANLAHDNGNHQNAINLYSQLDIFDSLSRGEKNKFASSLEYLDRWKDAFDIRKDINITNDTDIIDAFICAYYAGNQEALNNLAINKKQWTQSSVLNSLLLEIVKEDKDQIILLEKKLTASDFSSEKDQKGFLLVADYFHKAGEIEKAVHIMEECARNTSLSFLIVNRLYFYFQEMGKNEESRQILDTDFVKEKTDQKSFETYIKNLILSGAIDKADNLLKGKINKWELSPSIIDLSAKILIEKGEFLYSEEILRSLVDDDNCDMEYKFDYCLALLECRISDFPFGINDEKQGKFDEIRKLLIFNKQKNNILLELLEAELNNEKRLEKYQQLIQKYSEKPNSDSWRIFAGLGKVFFDLKQFDSAIINIKRAQKTVPNNEALFWLLVQCYSNLKLWIEIENLFNKSLFLDNRTILNGFRRIKVFSENLEWPRFLENQVQKNPEEMIYKILLAQSFVETEKRLEAAELVKSFYEKINVENEYYLICAQILIDAYEPQLAERLIEIYLSNKKTLDQKDYLSCAFLYDQLKKSEKALAMINHLDYQDHALLTYKAKLINDFSNIDMSQSLINQIINCNPIETINVKDIYVRIPEIVKLIQDKPALAYLVTSSFKLKSKDIDHAISILENGLKKIPDDQEILFNLLDILNNTGKNEDFEKVMETHNLTLSEIQSPRLLCLLGEIALSQNEEVNCARYLSDAIKLEPENPRVKALQARMIAINGNILEAQNILNHIIEDFDNSIHVPIINPVGQVDTNPKLWLANAALELKDYQSAIKISLEEINDFGYFIPCSTAFVSALSFLLENEFIMREIKVNNHIEPIEENTLKSFLMIVDNFVNAHSIDQELNDSIVKCQIFLEKNSKALVNAEALCPKTENINSIIYGIFESKGQEAAEIAFNSFNTNSEHELFLAILEKNDNPEKALNHLKNIIDPGTTDARLHALLAIIEKANGNLSDAYAAICLALDQWPEEYEWQIMAGNLSKAIGDLHTSLSHYEKAQRLNLKHGLDKDIEELNLFMETENAIPILEKQLSQNPNREQLIQLGKIYLKFGNFRKAADVFYSVLKNDPHDAMSYYWLSEIAIKLNNSDKALENIDKAMINDGFNNQIICGKARILRKIYGHDKALSFIDGELTKKNNSDDELLLFKIKLISESEGDKKAAGLLNSMNNLQENPVLLLEKARIEFRLGNHEEAELIAEKLLNQKDNGSDVLALLGEIAKARGEFDRSIDFYVKAIELNPFSTEQFIQLAEIYNDRKDFKLALETLEEGIKINPGSFNLLYKTGLYYYRHGLYSEAINRINEAIRIEPDHVDSKEILGLLENVMAVKSESLVNQFSE